MPSTKRRGAGEREVSLAQKRPKVAEGTLVAKPIGLVGSKHPLRLAASLKEPGDAEASARVVWIAFGNNTARLCVLSARGPMAPASNLSVWTRKGGAVGEWERRAARSRRRERSAISFYSAAFTMSDDQVIVSCSRHGGRSALVNSVRFYSPDGALLHECTYRGGSMWIRTLRVLDDNTFVAGDEEGFLSVWARPPRRRGGRCRRLRTGWKLRGKSLRYTDHFGVESEDAVLSFVRLGLHQLPPDGKTCLRLASQPTTETRNPSNLETVLVVYASGNCIEWAPRSGKFVRLPYALTPPDGSRVLAHCSSVLSASVPTGPSSRAWMTVLLLHNELRANANGSGQLSIACIGWDGCVRTRNLTEATDAKAKTGPGYPVACLASALAVPNTTSPCPYVAVGAPSGEVRIINTVTGQTVAILRDLGKDAPLALAFAPSLPLFASASVSGTICIYSSAGQQ